MEHFTKENGVKPVELDAAELNSFCLRTKTSYSAQTLGASLRQNKIMKDFEHAKRQWRLHRRH